MKQIIDSGIRLCIVAMIAASTLVYTYKLTESKIEENKKAREQELLKEVLPNASDFKKTEIKDKEKKYYIGYDKNDKKIGFIIPVTPKGYAGPIELLVGIDTECKVVNFAVLLHKETPGLGTKITTKEFKKQFKGKEKDDMILKKDDPDKGKIDAITASTISSRAVTKGIKEALEFVKNILRKE